VMTPRRAYVGRTRPIFVRAVCASPLRVSHAGAGGQAKTAVGT
jgi:hypothetical protein